MPLRSGGRVGLILLDQAEDARAGVVLKDHRLLGTEALQILEDRIGAVGDLLDEPPLGRVGQGHAHHVLEGLDALERQPQMVMGQDQVHLEAGGIGLLARLLGKARAEQRTAGPAAQLLELVAGDPRQRLPLEAQAHQGP
jgi:hypothetical protein